MEKRKKTSSSEQRMGSFDDIKHTVRRIDAVLQVIILTLLYYYTWKYSYRSLQTIPAYYGNGKFILTGIYAFLIILLFYLCDSFKYGHLKLMDVVISQWISLFIVNFITYFQLCLIANTMINVLPILLLMLVDMIFSFVYVYICTRIYHRQNVPKNMVLIYGNKNAVKLKTKLDTRSDKYRITKMINVNDKGINITEEIAEHDAVIINDVPAQIRNDILKYCYEKGIRTYAVPKISDIIIRGANGISLFDTPLFLIKGRGFNFEQRLLKRTGDIILCSIALIPCSIIMLMVAIAIKIEDGGPIFYKQTRITKDLKEFEILKFRSMIVNAEKEGKAVYASKKDPRITKVGHIIRPTRIDELPQLLNIIKGDMSIVGPRPERPEMVKKIKEDIPEFIYRTKVKAGLTGYAQIYGKYNTTAYDKVRLDLMYIENYSFFLDIKLMFMTLQILLKKESSEGFE